jgi:hypothetical protein
VQPAQFQRYPAAVAVARHVRGVDAELVEEFGDGDGQVVGVVAAVGGLAG